MNHANNRYTATDGLDESEPGNELYQCEKGFHFAPECKRWCGNCDLNGRIDKS